MKIKFADIIIPKHMLQTTPSTEKIYHHLYRFLHGADIAKEIIVDQNGVLRDGYARYCALMIDGYQYIPDLEIIVSPYVKNTTYICGKHRDDGAEYIWKVTRSTKNSKELEAGKYALVNTRYGRRVVKIVSLFETSEEIPSLKIKSVKSAIDKSLVSLDENGFFTLCNTLYEKSHE